MQLRATVCPVALDPAAPYDRALVLAHTPRLQTLPPYMGGLRGHHVSCGFEPRLPAWESSGATTRPAAPDPACLHRRALEPPRVIRL
jgi:hypothetical protein